jgi:hypothetical protein
MASDDTDGEEIPVSWLAVPYHGRVLGEDGTIIGTAESLLGDESADIFHGLVIKRDSDKAMVELKAERIPKITTKAIYTDLTAGEVAALEPYVEERWAHLGWGGLFRRRPEWENEGPRPPVPRIGGRVTPE